MSTILGIRPVMPNQVIAGLSELMYMLQSLGLPAKVIGGYSISPDITTTVRTVIPMLTSLPVQGVIVAPDVGAIMLLLPNNIAILVKRENMIQLPVDVALNYLMNKIIDKVLERPTMREEIESRLL